MSQSDRLTSGLLGIIMSISILVMSASLPLTPRSPLTFLFVGLLHALPQLCGKLPTDHDVIDDILDAVSKLQESFERNEDRNSFSSFSYECVEYDGDAASSDAYGEK